MAQFGVYRSKDTYLLDCQSDFLSDLQTRLVVPLLPLGEVPQLPRLNPVLKIEGERLVMATQLGSPMRAHHLRDRVTSLHQDHMAILNAFDLLLTGY